MKDDTSRQRAEQTNGLLVRCATLKGPILMFDPTLRATPIIAAHQIHKTFRTGRIEVHALRGIDLRTAYRARRMGFVFQTYNLLPVITAVENVELPLLVSGVSPRDARRRALDALDQVGLSDRSSHRPAELSGGQRQRVTIARALVNNPAIVWADEPTGNLDSKSAQDIVNVMRDLNRTRKQTFVIVTHDAGIGAQCDRIVRMQDGLIVDHGLETPALPPQPVQEA